MEHDWFDWSVNLRNSHSSASNSWFTLNLPRKKCEKYSTKLWKEKVVAHNLWAFFQKKIWIGPVMTYSDLFIEKIVRNTFSAIYQYKIADWLAGAKYHSPWLWLLVIQGFEIRNGTVIRPPFLSNVNSGNLWFLHNSLFQQNLSPKCWLSLMWFSLTVSFSSSSTYG